MRCRHTDAAAAVSPLRCGAPAPAPATHAENAHGEFDTTAVAHHYHMDRIRPRYHYTITNMRWLPDSDNAYERHASQ